MIVNSIATTVYGLAALNVWAWAAVDEPKAVNLAVAVFCFGVGNIISSFNR